MSDTVPWPVVSRTEHLILELRELLVRFDENQAAWDLLDRCVPFYLHDNRRIQAVRKDQHDMIAHLLDPEAYRAYYADNPHELRFEEQYLGATVDNAHEVFYRLKFLRDGLAEQAADGERMSLRVLDLACNDGAFAANLGRAGHYCSGIDLGQACIDRARNRTTKGDFVCDDILNAVGYFGEDRWHAVYAFEVVEHVHDPDELLALMCQLVMPGGKLYLSTPAGVDHGGDLPEWDKVEPKGHVRVYTAKTFHDLLARYGQVEQMHMGTDGVLVARVKP